MISHRLTVNPTPSPSPTRRLGELIAACSDAEFGFQLAALYSCSTAKLRTLFARIADQHTKHVLALQAALRTTTGLAIALPVYPCAPWRATLAGFNRALSSDTLLQLACAHEVQLTARYHAVMQSVARDSSLRALLHEQLAAIDQTCVTIRSLREDFRDLPRSSAA